VAKASRVGSTMGARNIRLGWKWHKVTNILAYYDSKLITKDNCKGGGRYIRKGWKWNKVINILACYGTELINEESSKGVPEILD
jgi:hypothetical protein